MNKSEWRNLPKEERKTLVIETMQEMAVNGVSPTRIRWNEERPQYMPKADAIIDMFGCKWSEVGKAADLVMATKFNGPDEDIGAGPIANGRRVEPQALNLAPPVMKRIWTWPHGYRTVEARMVI